MIESMSNKLYSMYLMVCDQKKGLNKKKIKLLYENQTSINYSIKIQNKPNYWTKLQFFQILIKSWQMSLL